MTVKKRSSGRHEEAVETESTAEPQRGEDDDHQDLTVRQLEVQAIKDSADHRDDRAAVRDVVADKRDGAADVEAFFAPGTEYTGLVQRRAAAQDRSQAKHDREASADDREQLAKEQNLPTDTD